MNSVRYPIRLRISPPSAFRRPFRNYSSSKPSRDSSSDPTGLDRLVFRLPKRLRPYASNLKSAPVSHITAFLILHEITAIVPLLCLFSIFHWGSWLPLDYVAGHWGKAMRDGVNKFEQYFKRKGLFGFSRDDDNAGQHALELEESELDSHSKYKLLVEIGLAWAVTKAILPLRIVVSLWGTPWCARVLVAVRRRIIRKK